MLISYNTARQRFEAATTYAERNEANPLLKRAGFAFDFNGTKLWHTAGYKATPKPQAEQNAIAARLFDYLDADAKARVHPADVAKAQAATQSLVDSRATDSIVAVPKPEGLEYLPFQRAGIAYAMARTNVLIADEMGLGKTIQGIGICNADASVRNVLIVCPASLKLNWRKEFTKWDVKGLTVGIADTKIGVPQTDVVIVNYDILVKLSDQLRARAWDVLIADECHKAKNPGAQRTQELLGKRTWIPAERRWNVDKTAIAAARRVFLTGTPIVNRPCELWPFVLSLDPEGLGKFKSVYEKRYCAAGVNRWGYYTKGGASNLDELQTKLRSIFMIRRLKSEVIKDLPAKRRQVILLEGDASTRVLVEKERAAYDALVMEEGEGVTFESMSAIRKQVAIAKLPFAIEHITDALEDVEKVVVMAHHHKVIDGLAQAFGAAAVVVDGRVPVAERQAAVDRFQTDPTCTVFIGSIQAAGVGLTLTAAHVVIFVELDWVPGNVTQAEDRCHRIGQTETVLVQHLVLNESVDANLADKIISKQAIIDQALDNRQPEIAKPQVGIVQPENAVMVRETNNGRPVVGGMTITGEYAMTPEQVAAVHQGLRALSAVCDGANQEDNHGFNKFDTIFGKDLAARAVLTPKQASAGRKLVQKYQRQLPVELVRAAGIIPMGEKS